MIRTSAAADHGKSLNLNHRKAFGNPLDLDVDRFGSARIDAFNPIIDALGNF